MANIDQLRIKNPKLDRRVKLLPEQKQEILSKKHLLGKTLSQRMIARQYGVSRRTIQFIIAPEKLELNKLARKRRGGSTAYGRKYQKENPDYLARKMREYRKYKKQLVKQGLLSFDKQQAL